jgi:hypothetical protein
MTTCASSTASQATWRRRHWTTWKCLGAGNKRTFSYQGPSLKTVTMTPACTSSLSACKTTNWNSYGRAPPRLYHTLRSQRVCPISGVLDSSNILRILVTPSGREKVVELDCRNKLSRKAVVDTLHGRHSLYQGTH